MEKKLEKRLYEYISGNPHTSFAEINKHFGDESKGGCSLSLTEYPSMVIWGNLSDSYVSAIEHLIEIKKIYSHPSQPLIYFIDGCVLDLPEAKRKMHYKKPHWLPVTLCTFPITNKRNIRAKSPVFAP